MLDLQTDGSSGFTTSCSVLVGIKLQQMLLLLLLFTGEGSVLSTTLNEVFSGSSFFTILVGLMVGLAMEK